MIIELQKDLQELPIKIKEQENIINGLTRKADNIKYAKNSVELRHKGQISRETNDDGKKAYGNETERERELYARLKDDKDYNDLVQDMIDTRIKLDEVTVEFNFLKRVFSATQYLVRLRETEQ